MIISASYKTDIPAFYGEWFMNRLQAGYCKMVNPYGRQVYRVSLTRPDVDGFVFWSKNIGPFLPHLPQIRSLGYPFVLQYSLTGYPRALESAVPSPEQSVHYLKRVADQYGPRAVVWRYDPILFTAMTPLDFHRRNFASLARQLSGTTDEVVVSFAHIYKKTRRNLEVAASTCGFTWDDPGDDVKLQLAAELVEVARTHGMRLTTCSQSQYCVPGAGEARCVDAQRMSAVAGYSIVAKQQGNRPDCRCDLSRDIGEYDTCTQGCVYCYAVQNRRLAQLRYRQHDPHGEFLFPSGAGSSGASLSTGPG
ncbi:MAG TPA: DUF1848 domain-containing protein [Symbiobacteriaceae bacterium]